MYETWREKVSESSVMPRDLRHLESTHQRAVQRVSNAIKPKLMTSPSAAQDITRNTTTALESPRHRNNIEPASDVVSTVSVMSPVTSSPVTSLCDGDIQRDLPGLDAHSRALRHVHDAAKRKWMTSSVNSEISRDLARFEPRNVRECDASVTLAVHTTRGRDYRVSSFGESVESAAAASTAPTEAARHGGIVCSLHESRSADEIETLIEDNTTTTETSATTAVATTTNEVVSAERSDIKHKLKSISLTSNAMSLSASKSCEKFCFVSDIAATTDELTTSSSSSSHIVASSAPHVTMLMTQRMDSSPAASAGAPHVSVVQRMSEPTTSTSASLLSPGPNRKITKSHRVSSISSTLNRLRHLAVPSFSKLTALTSKSTPSSPKSPDQFATGSGGHDDCVFTYGELECEIEPELTSSTSATYSYERKTNRHLARKYKKTKSDAKFREVKEKQRVATTTAMTRTATLSRSRSVGSEKEVPAYALFLRHQVEEVRGKVSGRSCLCTI